jgi:DtxR family Mn-dependent transcriptional regulator
MSPFVGELSSSLEDYLEAILVLTREKKVARVRDIAARLGVAMSSVDGALRRLADEDLVRHERYEFVELTEKGVALARKIFDRHNLLTHLLHDILGVDAETAEKDACAIEHHVSQKTIQSIIDFSLLRENEEKYPTLKDSRVFHWHHGWREKGGKYPTLKDIPPGKSARVVRLTSHGAILKRMLDMGISAGVVIEVKRVAPLGDPMEVAILGYNLSLRKNEANYILVEPLS